MGNLHRRKRKERKLGRRAASEAWEALEAGDVEGAERYLRSALRGHEDDAILWNDLDVILWRGGRLREAEDALENAILIRPEFDEARTNLASLLASRGFYRQALRVEEELLSRRPLHREFHEKRIAEYRREIARLEAEEEEPGPESEADPGTESEAHTEAGPGRESEPHTEAEPRTQSEAEPEAEDLYP